MSSYDIERSRQESEEIRKVFREIFPLAPEHDLPWATCHIKQFLRGRIASEVSDATFHFTSRVCRVLCEISPPKTHPEDMARIVVEEAKRSRRLEQTVGEQAEQIKTLKAKELAVSNTLACLLRMKTWASQEPTGPVDAGGVSAWVIKMIDNAINGVPPDTK